MVGRWARFPKRASFTTKPSMVPVDDRPEHRLLPAVMARERRFVELRGYRSWPSNNICTSVTVLAELSWAREGSLTPLEKSRTACQDDTCFAVASLHYSWACATVTMSVLYLSGGSHRRACCSLLTTRRLLADKAAILPRHVLHVLSLCIRGTSRCTQPTLSADPELHVTHLSAAVRGSDQKRRRENPCIALGIAERLRPPDIHVSDNVC